MANSMARVVRTCVWRNPISFWCTTRAHFSTPLREPACPANVPRLSELRENGICVVENFFEPALIRRMREEVWQEAERLRYDKLGDGRKYRRMPDDSLYRLHDTRSFAPSTRGFYENAELADLVAAYMGPSYRVRAGYLDYKVGKAKFDSAAIPHIDNYLREIKIFLLLDDCAPNNAPMVYWRGSHARRSWRWPYDYMCYTGTAYGINGFVACSILDEQEELGTVKPMTCTGQAGTMFVVDTRGVHRATILEDDHRLQLVDVYKP